MFICIVCVCWTNRYFHQTHPVKLHLRKMINWFVCQDVLGKLPNSIFFCLFGSFEFISHTLFIWFLTWYSRAATHDAFSDQIEQLQKSKSWLKQFWHRLVVVPFWPESAVEPPRPAFAALPSGLYRRLVPPEKEVLCLRVILWRVQSAAGFSADSGSRTHVRESNCCLSQKPTRRSTFSSKGQGWTHGRSGGKTE